MLSRDSVVYAGASGNPNWMSSLPTVRIIWRKTWTCWFAWGICLALHFASIREVDINPVMIDNAKPVAADAIFLLRT